MSCGYFLRKMDPKSNKQKFPAELSLAACLSTGITLVITPIYIVLCILALVYRVRCNSGMFSSATGDSYFIYTLYRIYIQTNACGNAGASPPAGVLLMTPDTVFVFVVIILTASILCCAAAITLIVVAVNKKSEWVFATIWTYVCVSFASIVVDITFAAFFGKDYAEMSFTMHPIHKVGAINAYEQHANRGFVGEEPRRNPRSQLRAASSQMNSLPPPTPLSDHSNSRDYDRSNSWQHNPASVPFNYMEEPRRLRTSPAAGEQWRRDPWPPAPPVPAPDYSPPARRLKSALKPNYM